MIYNLSPAQKPPEAGYLPWADGRCPFPREAWSAAGFEVVAFDVEDGDAARGAARILGWEKEGTDLEATLFAHYSVFRRAGGSDG